MSAVLGNVVGDICPHCNCHLDLEGEFFEGSEIHCSCGALCEIISVNAVYTVQIGLLALPEKEEEQE